MLREEGAGSGAGSAGAGGRHLAAAQGTARPSVNTWPIFCRISGEQLTQRDFYLGRAITFGLSGFKVRKRRREQARVLVVGIKSRPARKPPAATAFVPWKTLNFIARDV